MPHKGIASRKLFTCLFAMYVLNVFGKIAFSAVTVELVDAEIITKTEVYQYPPLQLGIRGME